MKYFVEEKIINVLELLIECESTQFKFFLCSAFVLFIVLITILDIIYYSKIIDLKSFKKYIKDCKNLIAYNKEKIYNKYPYIAICLSAFNMERFIEKNLFSIINQSFPDFEIIIVNDASEDETENIIKRMQLDDDRIKLISHSKNLGVYRSRIESILNSKSKFVLLMDPDDMYMNENLFQDLYNINIKQNFDIIEFSIFHQYEGRNKINYPRNDSERHYHKFGKDIIYQPELSNILFYLPGTNKYSSIICRNIWNKLIRKDIFIQINKYLGKDYYHKFIISTDAMLMNIISYQFAKNYTNLNIPGYLNTIRKNSSPMGNGSRKLKEIRALNYLLYFKLFYKYIQDYNKDINFLYYEMNTLNEFILELKESKMVHYKQIQISLMQQILNEKNLSIYFKSYLENMLMYFKY